MQSRPRFKSYVKSVEQAQVYLGFPCYYENDIFNKQVLEVIACLLGGNMSSRLFINLREKEGLVYSVSCELDTYIDAGIVYISFGTFNNKVKKVINIILKELEKIREEGITKTELKETIDFMIGNEEMTSEDNEVLNTNIAYQYILTNKIHTDKDRKKVFNKIKLDDIKRIANEIFDNKKLNVYIISNNKVKNFIKTKNKKS